MSEVLGTADVSVLEMSNAYATFANGGVHHDPTAINRVEFPNGDTEELDPSTGKRAFSDGVAYTVADVMKGALEYGTAAGQGIGCPASGKTGTTEEQSDVWFVGYTPHVSTAVWMGNPNDPHADARVRRGSGRPDLERLHDGRGHRAVRRLPRAAEPGRALVFIDWLRGRHDATRLTQPIRPTPIRTAPEPGVDTDGDGYPDDAYLPGTGDPDNPGNGSPPANTPGNGDPGAGGTP